MTLTLAEAAQATGLYHPARDQEWQDIRSARRHGRLGSRARRASPGVPARLGNAQSGTARRPNRRVGR
jgi:hypothetical protein